MLECRDKLRCDTPDNYTYHDRLFANRMNYLIQLTDANYEDTMYREALKTGFYDLQVSNDALLKYALRNFQHWSVTSLLFFLSSSGKTLYVRSYQALYAGWLCWCVQAARDSYRDLTAPSGGMNWNLVRRFIEVSHTLTVVADQHKCR